MLSVVAYKQAATTPICNRVQAASHFCSGRNVREEDDYTTGKVQTTHAGTDKSPNRDDGEGPSHYWARKPNRWFVTIHDTLRAPDGGSYWQVEKADARAHASDPE